jgi:glycosyltransferase involved in cell wall biosynthesis
MQPPNDSFMLVTLAAVTWDFPLVGRTRMLTEAWLRAGQPTTFVQIASLRTALERVARAFRLTRSGFVVRPWPIYPSRLWPYMTEPFLRRAIRRRAVGLRKQLDRVIDFTQASAIVVSPGWTPWLEVLPFRRVIYDCIDEVSVHAPQPELIPLYRKWEQQLVQRASAAVVTAEPLRTALQRQRPGLPIAMIRNGVDVERFQKRARTLSRPKDLPARGRPLIGFVGALYAWIDWPLIANVARLLPDHDFVFIGPYDGRSAIDRVSGLDNVRFLGARPYENVPAYVQAFDACWVPFDQSAVSRAANPVKIYEYLALGKPVVSTPVADSQSFEGYVRVGRTPAEISDHVRAALAEAGGDTARRVEFARANSWEARAAEYVAFVNTLAG